MNEVEETFVKTFIVHDKRERWLSLLSSEKKRRKLLARLPHLFAVDLEPRFIYDEETLPPDVAVQIENVLNKWKSSNSEQLCYLVSYQSKRSSCLMLKQITF